MVLGTQIPSYNQAAWTQRLLQLFPPDWTNDAAKSQGGVLFAMMAALGAQIQFLNAGVTYAWNSTRIKTATDSTLDLVSQDYFGTTLPRAPGEPDSSFRSRIIANLFLPAATRPAISQLIQNLTGATPRIMESWNAPDTGYWDSISFYDIDQYVAAPFRWADPSLQYQGFVESVLPPINSALANNFPIWCYDAGFTWDAPNSYWLDPQASWFIQTGLMDAAIKSVKAEGTTIWRKYSSVSYVTVPVGGSRLLAPGATTFYAGILPFGGLYAVIAQANWNSSAFISQTALQQFTVGFTAPAVAGSSFDFVAAPVSQVGVGVIPLGFNATVAPIAIPSGFSGYIPIACPSWATNIWISNVSGSTFTFSFSNSPSLGGSMNYMFFPPSRSGSQSVSMGATTAIIALSGPSNPFEFFVMPDWDTTVSITAKSPTSVSLAFNTPAPAAQTIRYAYQNG